MVTIPTSTWDSVLSTTLPDRETFLVDNITNNNSLLERMTNMREGKVRDVSGGATLLHPMNLIESATGDWYAGLTSAPLAA